MSRLLYEAAFPRLLWLARPLPVLLFALLTAVVGWLCWRWVNRWLDGKQGQPDSGSLSVWVLTPLLLNLPTLFVPTSDLTNSRLLFVASIWLTALLIAGFQAQERSWTWLGPLFVLAALLPAYLITMPQTVGSADTFEFQVVIPQLGIAHPTGYPLYLLLGRLFSLIPLGTAAWRINLASAVFAILAAMLLYAAARRLLKQPLPALLAAVSLGFTPVVWSQAIVAEVYALHALFVAAVLWLIVFMLDGSANDGSRSDDLLTRPIHMGWQVLVLALAFLIGLGLANHLTTLFLLPPAILAVLLAYGGCLRRQGAEANMLLLLKSVAAFLLPLLLYAYLPIRWSAVNGEAMGFGRFTQWVIGGRFQGALQLSAWLTDMTRYQVVGRLLQSNWGWLNLALIVVGLLYLIKLNWRAALVLFVAWLGFVFYALNYYVPDLAVFLVPAHIVMAIGWAAGLTAVLAGSEWLLRGARWSPLRASSYVLLLLLLLLPSLLRLSDSWRDVQGNDNSRLLAWGEGVLAMPLDDGAAILADSEKIAPLYYLQQAEGVRPDLDIMVLPDEAAYRAELDARIAAGQTVYLARFLPGLEGVYHLRSAGPLVEVSREPLPALPLEAQQSQLSFGPLQLTGFAVQEMAAVDPDASAVTLFWQADGPQMEATYVYMRWAGPDFTADPVDKSGQHTVDNMYPTAAWRADEIVPDFHLLPQPVLDQAQEIELQLAVGPAFAAPQDLAWQTVTEVTIPAAGERALQQPLRAQNGRVLLSGVQFPREIRPQTPLPVTLSGYGSQVQGLQLSLQPSTIDLSDTAGQNAPAAAGAGQIPFAYAVEVGTDLPNGRYYLVSRDPQMASICGWLARQTNGCVLGEVTISGVTLPDGATNYEDKIALLEVDLPQRTLQPGAQFPVNLRWQGLAPMNEDYTVFIQVLNAQDQIVGQVDAWPLQGTHPTSQWEPGELVDDPHLVQLDAELPSGPYRLQIGWYLLSTLRRLPLVDEDGAALDDKKTISDLVVP